MEVPDKKTPKLEPLTAVITDVICVIQWTRKEF
jgi:hypothetical protein